MIDVIRVTASIIENTSKYQPSPQGITSTQSQLSQRSLFCHLVVRYCTLYLIYFVSTLLQRLSLLCFAGIMLNPTV